MNVGERWKRFRNNVWITEGNLYYKEDNIPKWYTIKWFATRRRMESVEIPKRYGLAYLNFECDTVYYALIPLNVLLGFLKWFKFKIKWELPNILIMKERDYIIERAYSEGYTKGISALIKNLEEEVNNERRGID